MEPIRDLMTRFAGAGVVTWIGLRPERLAPVRLVEAAEVTAAGLAGDHGRAGKRALTLIVATDLDAIAHFLGRDPAAPIEPTDLRRNLVVSGINLVALRGMDVDLGTARLRITGPCAPCSRMERVLGRGGYTAMRGHGGMTAEVLAPGRVARGDPLFPVATDRVAADVVGA